MKVKQLLELMKNMTTFVNCGNKNYEAYIDEYSFYVNNSKIDLSENLEDEIRYIKSINPVRKIIHLESCDSAEINNDTVALEELLNALSKTIFINDWLNNEKFTDKNIPIEITISKKTGNEKVFWKGTNINNYRRTKPFAWDILKNLIVEEITEINYEKEYVLKIVVNGMEEN